MEEQVRRINRSNGEEELVPVSSAAQMLTNYYNLSREQITEALLNMVPMTTAGYVYTRTTLDAKGYMMAADAADASIGDRQAAQRFNARAREGR